ncbi:MAG: rod shape-determining protein MreC [Lautropia sp.]|nr:rod shape-determining protein MreC [Lautropia sp.]
MTDRRVSITPHQTGLAVVLCTAALALMVSDARLHLLEPLRHALAGALYPVQYVLTQPRDLLRKARTYTTDVHTLRQHNEVLRQSMTRQARVLAQTEALREENRTLRELAGLSPRVGTPSLVAEVVMQPRAPGSQKRLLNKGSAHGVSTGQPVVDVEGVVGQVTRVYPHSSEMTLITDSAISVPVTVQRNRLHAIAFGTSRPNRLELRFQTADADLKEGDRLLTSGLDFVYPPGLPVGVIASIQQQRAEPFSDIAVRPIGNHFDPRLVLILLSNTAPAPLEANADNDTPAPP